MTDIFQYNPELLTAPARNAYEVTPDDNADLDPVPRELYIGTGGNLSLTMQGYEDEMQPGATVTIQNVPDGSRVPYRAIRVRATGTTAAGIVAIY